MLVALVALVSVASADPAQDQIQKLPGLYESINFNQYSGYRVVNESHGRRLFYWFVESQNDPANDPVVLWLNGGPGCSSLGGFFTELGPFIPNEDLTLSINPYSWNTVANIIFLESPSGVGFSYSDTPADYNTGDFQTANDSYTFLLQFFQDFPELAGNDFYVAGESYGGHYVPELALRIYNGNTVPGVFQINLKGFLVGNGWTVPAIDNWGAAYYWYTHAIVSESTYNGLYTTCNFSDIGPLVNKEKSFLAQPQTINDTACNDYQNIAFNEMGFINIYDIYQDMCLPGDNNTVSNQAEMLMSLLAETDDSPLSHYFRAREKRKHQIIEAQQGDDPCVDNWLQMYLNQPDVQEAIHVNASGITNWTDCSSIVNYSRKDLLTPILDVYDQLLGNIRIMVYSGDVDAIVPVTGTRAWLDQLNLTTVAPWAPWLAPDGQVGGYVTEYDGLTFTTIRNAGHMVPGTQPLRAVTMFRNFLQGTPFTMA